MSLNNSSNYHTYLYKKDTYMLSKLTLSIDRDVIEKAKKYAQSSGRSLSDLIESYLESLTEPEQHTEAFNLPPKLKKLFGAAQIPVALDHRKEIRKIIKSKNKN